MSRLGVTGVQESSGKKAGEMKSPKGRGLSERPAGSSKHFPRIAVTSLLSFALKLPNAL